MCARWAAHPDHRDAGQRRADHLGAVPGQAAPRDRAAGAVRGAGQGGHRAGLARRVHGSAAHLPGAAHHLDRHRAQLDRGDDADRGPAQAIAAARDGAADAAARAAADQREARAEGAAARRPQRRGGGEESGNRAGAPRGRGEGDRARAHLEVQVRIPRQHVARAAHAAQQHPHSRPAAHGEPGRQSVGQAGGVRAHHPRRGDGPAQSHQRHSRSFQDRIRHRVGGRRGGLFHQFARDDRPAVPPRGRESPAAIRGRALAERRAQHHHRLEAPAAGAQEPVVECVQIHGRGRRQAQGVAGGERLERGSPDAAPCRLDRRLRGVRYRHRHSAGKTAHHLRGLPAGRRGHQPQVRRHGPRARDQPRAC